MNSEQAVKAILYTVNEGAVATSKIFLKGYFGTLNATEKWFQITEKFDQWWSFSNGLGAAEENKYCCRNLNTLVLIIATIQGLIVLLSYEWPAMCTSSFAEAGKNGRISEENGHKILWGALWKINE